MIPVPTSCVGFVTGSQGNFLRTWALCACAASVFFSVLCGYVAVSEN